MRLGMQSHRGDSDTLAAITGGVAEAYYGIPAEIRKHALTFLDKRQLQILVDFENKYPPTMEKEDRRREHPVERKSEQKVSGTDRGSLIEDAVRAADEDAFETPEEKWQSRNSLITF